MMLCRHATRVVASVCPTLQCTVLLCVLYRTLSSVPLCGGGGGGGACLLDTYVCTLYMYIMCTVTCLKVCGFSIKKIKKCINSIRQS